MLFFGVAMVVVMLVRPAGLWPSAVRKRELSRDAGAPAAVKAAAGGASSARGGQL